MHTYTQHPLIGTLHNYSLYKQLQTFTILVQQSNTELFQLFLLPAIERSPYSPRSTNFTIRNYLPK
jgi:hypothetical protein